MTEQVDISDAKTHLFTLLERVEAGEEIIIARKGRPVARLVPAQRDRPPRVPGSLAGRIWMSPDFDEPDDELIDLFYNGDRAPSASSASMKTCGRTHFGTDSPSSASRACTVQLTADRALSSYDVPIMMVDA